MASWFFGAMAKGGEGVGSRAPLDGRVEWSDGGGGFCWSRRNCRVRLVDAWVVSLPCLLIVDCFSCVGRKCQPMSAGNEKKRKEKKVIVMVAGGQAEEE